MAQDEKAQSQLQPDVFAPRSGADGGDEMPEEWDEQELVEGDEDYDDYEEDEPEDEGEAEMEDAFEVNGATVIQARPANSAAVSPAASQAPKSFGSFSPRQTGGAARKKSRKLRARSNGLKKGSLKKSQELDLPPTPLGCEWRDADDGWSLWRCWSERDNVIGGRYKKERYAGHLSREAWQVMKQYDYETFIAVIGRRFRRHGGR